MSLALVYHYTLLPATLNTLGWHPKLRLVQEAALHLRKSHSTEAMTCALQIVTYAVVEKYLDNKEELSKL